MKAYVILAHKYPAQVYRLVQALDDGASTFFIHIDKRARLDEFNSLRSFGSKIHFLPRVKTSWASYGLVRATLHGMSAIRDSSVRYSHVILLSGQDYPIRSNEWINQFMQQHPDQVFLEYHALPHPEKWQPNGGLYRVNKYFFGLRFYQRYSAKALNFLGSYLPFLRRKIYRNMKPYAGSMWWILNREALEYILDFIKIHPEYIAFHQHTFAADEVFFHTILGYALDGRLHGKVVNDDMRFIQWKDISASHPEVLKKDQLDQLISSHKLFARKFDGQEDPEILDLLDQYRTAHV